MKTKAIAINKGFQKKTRAMAINNRFLKETMPIAINNNFFEGKQGQWLENKGNSYQQ